MAKVASQNCIDLIKRFEGCQLKPYKCPAGVWTIGYGSTKGITENTPAITQEQADRLLAKDMQWAVNAVNQKVNVDLTQNEFDSLVSFVFNIGAAAFVGSTLYKKLRMEDYYGAAEEFPKWCHAGGKVLQGLVTRREAEKELFLRD